MTTSDSLLSPNPFREWPRSEIEQTLHGRFERIVAASCDREAVITRSERVTYRTLNALANRVARAIVARIGAEAEPVVLLFQQGLPAIVATLAALKAGKFYIPLEPGAAASNVSRLLEDSQARLMVTDARGLAAGERCGTAVELLDIDKLDAALPDRDPGLTVSPDALAYVYYTSGSTGPPKGVMDSHRNVLHNVRRYTNRLRIGADDRLTLLQPFGFSGAVSSLFCALLNGASVVPIGFRDDAPGAVAKWLEESRVTIYHSVPSAFRALVGAGRSLPNVRLIRLEGDQASPRDVELYRRHFGPDCVLVNGLGTTETGIVCQYFVDRATSLEDATVPVGYPAADIQIRVLKEDSSRVVGAGEVGEIAVVGQYLSPGYWRNPDLTQRAFGSDPLGAGRMYRTGDLGRVRADGCLEYLGRRDARRKVRGQWVALADVEAALARLDEVRAAVVTAREDAAGEAHLVAYIVPDSGHAAPVSALRRRLAADLPAHMVPTHYVALEALPVSNNGKVDRKALPPPLDRRPALEQEYVSPSSLLQQRIAQVWEEILGVRPVGVRDNFLDLGGDSLQAIRMVDRLEEVLGREIPVSALVEAADVETLADVLFEHGADLHFPLVKIRAGGSRLPFFFLHGDYLSGGFYCLELARRLGPDQPFFALPPFGLDSRPVPESYEQMATQHLRTLRAFQPTGPYRLGGTCNGGLVAFEMARQLIDAGQQVDLLLLIGASAEPARSRRMEQTITAAGEVLRSTVGERGSRPLRGVAVRLLATLRAIVPRRSGAPQARGEGGSPIGRLARETPQQQRDRLRDTYLRIDRRYTPSAYAHPVTLFWAADDPQPAAEAARHWARVAPKVDLHVIPGTHLGSLTGDVHGLAERMKHCLSAHPQPSDCAAATPR